MSNDEWHILLRRLQRAYLIKLRAEQDEQIGIDAHPLIREYFAKQLRETQPKAFQAAHARLFEHLCETTPYRPDTLDRLQPLYQAVVHGCLAGRQRKTSEKVYLDRIRRGGDYSWSKLGASSAELAAVAAFFDEPWSHVSLNLTEGDRAWLLDEAAFYLRALGRLTESLQPMRAGLEMNLQQKDWTNAANSAINRSGLEVTLGRLPDAVADARQSIIYADLSSDALWRIRTRSVAAHALHQSGQRMEAGTLFTEAERMQKEEQPEFHLLYSLQGFQYCDWLLAPAERAAWLDLLGGPGASLLDRCINKDEQAASCVEIERRATTTLKWMVDDQQAPLLTIALEHLTLARAELVRAVLTHQRPQPTLDLSHVAAAVIGLRNAGTMDVLPNQGQRTLTC